MALTAEEQGVVDRANSEDNFLGFDDSGNAIIRNANGQLNSYGGGDWANVVNALKTSPNGNKSFNDYVGQQQLKAVGGTFKGVDEETGAAVFEKDGQTFGVAKDDPNYKNLFNTVTKQNPNTTWFNPDYEKQFNLVKDSGNTFKGFNAEGKAVFQNKLGQDQIIDPSQDQAGFIKFAKHNLSDQKFTGPEGNSNAASNQNLFASAPQSQVQRQGTDAFSKQSAYVSPGAFSKFAASQQQPTTASTKPAATSATSIPVSGASAMTAAPTKAAIPKKPVAAPMSLQDKLLTLGKSYATDQLADAKAKGLVSAQNYATNAASPYVNQATSSITNQATTSAAPVINQATSALAPYLDQAKAIKNGVTGTVQDITGIDPTKSLSGQAMDMAKGAAANQFGTDNVNLASSVAGLLSGGNVVKNATNAATNYAVNSAKDTALNSLSDATGVNSSLLSAGAGLLKGNIINNAKDAATAQAKQYALNQLAGATGVDINALTGALDLGKNLTSGGLSADKANAAGQLAARAGLSYLSGGLASPESLSAGASLSDKGVDMSKSIFGNTTGSVLAAPLSIASNQLGAASGLAKDGINIAGNSAADQYNNISKATNGLKMLGSGDVSGGLQNIAKAALSSVVSNAVSTPVSVAKAVVNSVTNTVKKIFCFDGNTLIKMADGSVKKAKDIKVGDKLAVGGEVIGAGEALSDDVRDYEGVLVSAGHAVFEDGKWLRVGDSKKAKPTQLTNHKVYPIACAEHIIITSNNQVWADMTEIDDTHDYTDVERIQKLNSMKHKNKLLKVFVNAHKKL